mmetsp:Transcript_9823/g.17954  ORF Transcript_9823/g.17954 Transcript_9823/m.17954 type:complete len:83 (-) Transcript_9823:22-270(-)
MRNNAVSWAVKRKDPSASHWMLGKAATTGELKGTALIMVSQGSLFLLSISSSNRTINSHSKSIEEAYRTPNLQTQVQICTAV